MKKRLISKIVAILMIISLIPVLPAQAETLVNTTKVGDYVGSTSIKDNQIVERAKIWTIKFNNEIVLDETNKQSITVKDSKGTIVTGDLSLGQDSKSIVVNPPTGGYVSGEKYTLNISENLQSAKGKKIKSGVTMNFSIKNIVNEFSIEYSWNSAVLPPEYCYKGNIKINSNLDCEINYLSYDKILKKMLMLNENVKFTISEEQKNTLYNLMVDNQFDTREWKPVDPWYIPAGGAPRYLSGILNGKKFSINAWLNQEESEIVSPVYKFIEGLIKANFTKSNL